MKLYVSDEFVSLVTPETTPEKGKKATPKKPTPMKTPKKARPVPSPPSSPLYSSQIAEMRKEFDS